jgi:hypothetical protein
MPNFGAKRLIALDGWATVVVVGRLRVTQNVFHVLSLSHSKSYSCDLPLFRQIRSVGIRHSVWRLVTGSTVRGSNPGRDEIFRTSPARACGPPSLLCNNYRLKRPKRGVNHQLITRNEVNLLKTERRPLHLKTQSVPRCKHFSSRL